MAYKYQLIDAKSSGALKNISGVSSASPQFIDLMNEAQRRLIKRGDFYGMTQTMDLMFQGKLIAWPREVGTVIAVRGCGHPMQIQNQWYSFTGSWRHGHNHFHGDVVFEDVNPAPIFNEIYNVPNGMLIRYYVTNPADIGKTCTIYGHKYGAQPLQEVVGGKTVDGLTLTGQNPWFSTDVYVTDIFSITRQPTFGMTYLYQFNPANSMLVSLAAFEPNETNPRYRRTFVRNHQTRFLRPGETPSTTPKWNNVEALVKLEFIPVVNDRDFLLVDDMDALKFMVQAIKAEEANDHATAETLITKAIRELNFADREKNPDEATPVVVRSTFGNRTLRNPT
jgi:hypothetical protein